jgi:hypothetical protein
MKTLKQFMEATGYLKVKSPDEQKFIDKHKTDTIPDANGNGDEVFKASKVKMDDRRKHRHGYNPGEDEKVYEAVETERVKHPVGQRPKGPGWVLKQAGEQTGKDHNVWERKFKRVNEALKGYKSDSPRRGRRYGPMDRKPIKLMRKKKKAIDKFAKEEFTQSIEALSPRLQEAMVSVHDRLSEENRQKFVAACQTEEGLEKMVAFALENRGV